MRLIILFISLALVCSCTDKKAHVSVKRANAGTLITEPCAVLVNPSNAKISEFKKNSSEDAFAAVIDDNEYYLFLATEYLDSVKIKRIEKESVGTLDFKTVGGEQYTVKLETMPWGIILFNGKEKPIKAEVTDIRGSYESYMKN